MDPIQAAAAELRAGQPIDATTDVAIAALGQVVGAYIAQIRPTSVGGRQSLVNLRKLTRCAGLDQDHPVHGWWMALRALNPNPGERVTTTIDCPATLAILRELGLSIVDQDADLLLGAGGDIDLVPLGTDTAGVPSIATPAGLLVGANLTPCATAGWAEALAAAEASASAQGRGYDADPNAPVTLDWTVPDHARAMNSDAVFEGWSPEIAIHPSLKAHPAPLIQSATLATVTQSPCDYHPTLTRRLIDSGLISDAQFEFIVAAGQAHSRMLPPSADTNGRASRVGILLADGTGAGKTHEVLGCILDNILKGRNRHIVILEKERHFANFDNTWGMFGRDRRDFIQAWGYGPGARLPNRNGTVVLTYTLLRDKKRLRQLIDWAGPDFDGVLAFDEAHNMRNAAADDSSGMAQVSAQGMAGVELQDSLANARVIYASATGATDVHNLAYMPRLGLWGEGTAFDDRSAFIHTFEKKGDVADFEQVLVSLKAAGLCVSRTLSLVGVEVDEIKHTMSNEERLTFDKAADAWSRLRKAAEQCMELCGIISRTDPMAPKDSKNVPRRAPSGESEAMSYARLIGIFEGSRRQATSTLVSAFKTKTVIEDAKKMLAKGKSVVIQLQNTYEAQLDRALANCTDPSQIRLEPAELVGFASKLPIHRHKVELDYAHRNARNEPRQVLVLDRDEHGNPVVDPAAQHIRDTLVAELRQMKLPMPPLDQIMIEFGPSMVAEVTGRSKRIVTRSGQGRYTGGNASDLIVEERSEFDRRSDVEAFQQGDKLVMIFSVGAGGSGLGYHAKKGTRNPRQRVHYLLQLGDRADLVAQGTGRTNRSDQVCPPHLRVAYCDLPADMFYKSRVIDAMFRLGALSQGHRHAASNNMFDEQDNLLGSYAKAGWDTVINDIAEGKFKGYTANQFALDMGGGNPAGLSYHQILNRVAALAEKQQWLIFDALKEAIAKNIEADVAANKKANGPSTLTAKAFDVIDEQELSLDQIHGSKTRVIRLRKEDDFEVVPFIDAWKIYSKVQQTGLGRATFYRHVTNGQIALIATAQAQRDLFGRLDEMFEVITPLGRQKRPAAHVRAEPWRPWTDLDEAERYWDAKIAGAAGNRISYVNIVADALLPVWDPLNKVSFGATSVVRLQTQTGRRIIGREVKNDTWAKFCETLKIPSSPSDAMMDEWMTQLENGATIVLASYKDDTHRIEPIAHGPNLIGFNLCLNADANGALSAVLGLIPGMPANRASGSSLAFKGTPAEIRAALGAIFTIQTPEALEGAVGQAGAASVPPAAPAVIPPAANNNAPLPAQAA